MTMKYQILASLFLVFSCVAYDAPNIDPDAMQPARQTQAVNRPANQPEPHNPADVDTPPFPGHFHQTAQGTNGPRSTADGEFFNDVQGELMQYQAALGHDYTVELPGRTALAEMCQFSEVPVPETLSLVDLIAVTDVLAQKGFVQRHGNTVHVKYAITWANTNALLDGQALKLRLPYEATVGANVSGTVYPESNFQGQNGAGPLFYARMDNFLTPDRVSVVARSALGVIPSAILIGDGDGEGSRQIEMDFFYQTNGVRSTEWPSAAWTEIKGIYNPIGSPEPTLLRWRVDGAQPGDDVELLDQTFTLVPGSTTPVVNTPKERGTFDLTALGATPQTFYVSINGFLSPGFTVT